MVQQVSVRCSHCGKTFLVQQAALGRSGLCRSCGNTFVVQAADDTRLSDPQPAATPTPAAVIKELGRFHIRAILGEGAFGVVYRAHDPRLDREVALKVPHAHVLNHPQRIKRFLREAQTAARLRHPHIVPVFDAGRHDHHHFIASAFIAGQPLAQAIPEAGMDPARAARLTHALAQAVAYAHGLGVVHRDIKPANVMLDEADQPHLMDFGLASQLEQTERLTHDGAILGTPSYMAPEQAHGQQGEAQPASDQYSLGVLLYELATGKVPFAGSAQQVMYAAMHQEPPSPRAQRPDMPRDLETIILKCLRKDPAQRYARTEDLAEDLRRYLAGEPIAARQPTWWERGVRWCRQRPAVAGLLGLLLLVIGVSLGLLIWQLGEAGGALAQLEEEQRTREEQRLAAVSASAEADQERRRAEAALKQAEGALQRAEAARVDAEKLGQEEDEQRALAEKLRQAEQEQRQRAEEALRRAGQQGSASLLANLQRLLAKDAAGGTTQLLKVPKEQRGWEWEHLRRQVARDGAPEQFGNVRQVHWSADGERFACLDVDGAYKGRLRVFTKEGTLVHAIQHDLGYRPEDFTVSEGKWAFSNSRGYEIIYQNVFEPEKKTKVGVIKNIARNYKLCLDQKGEKLAAWDGIRLGVFDVKNEKSIFNKTLDSVGIIRDCYFEPTSGSLLVVGPPRVLVFDLPSGKQAKEFIFPGKPAGVPRLEIHGNDDLLSYASTDAGGVQIQMWKIPGMAKGESYRMNYPNARLLAVFPEKKWAASVVNDYSEVFVHDLVNGKKLFTSQGHGKIQAAAFSPTGEYLFAGRPICLFRRQGQWTLQDRRSPCLAIAWDAKGDQPITAGGDGLVRHWSRDSARPVKVVEENRGAATQSVFSPDGLRVASLPTGKVKGQLDNSIRVFDLQAGDPPKVVHEGRVRALAWSQHGLISADSDGVFRLWDDKGALKAKFTPNPKAWSIHAVAFHPEHKRLAFGGDGGTVRLWDLETDKEIGSGLSFGAPVHSLRFSREGKWLAAGGGDKTGLLTVFNAGSGEVKFSLNAHDAPIQALALHPTQDLAATASRDGVIKLWDLLAGQETITLRGHQTLIRALEFSPSGHWLASGDGDGVLKLWDGRPQE